MDQRFSLDRTSFERFLATASLLQQLQKRAVSLDSHTEDLAPQLTELVNTQQAIQAGTLSVDAALLRISALALRLVPAQGAGVWLFSGDALLYRAGTGTASSEESLRGAISTSLASVSDTPRDNSPIVHSPLMRSLLVAPIYQGQKIAGGLAVLSEKADCFNDRDQANTRLLSGLAAQALDKAANARFKQTVTLEREAVLHVIGALVPSLRDLVETTPDNEPEAARSIDSAASEISAPVWSAADSPDFLITAHNFPNEAKTEKVQDSLLISRTDEPAAPPEGASNATPTKGVPLSSSLPCFEEWARAAGISDLGVTQRPEHAATLREVESASVQKSVNTAVRESESAGFVASILTAAKIGRSQISASHVQSSIRSWFQLCESSLARMASLTAGWLNDLVARASKTKLLAGQRSIPRRRLVAAMGFVIAATLLTVKVASKLRLKTAKTATTVSHVDNVKPVKPLIVDGSHRRVTDDATSAALGELSHFEIPGLLRQARFGDDAAAFLIGMAYETGRGVPQSCEKAARWVQQAAMGGDAAAEYNLSLRYRDGDGLLADSEQSEKWLQKAAARKYPQALTQAGLETNQPTATSSHQ